MNFNEIQGLIEKLKKRIRDHGEELAKSEWATRYALIDPLLRGMGWDTGDRAQVKPEYKTRAREKPDYVLFKDDIETPEVVVEAKKLSTNAGGQEGLLDMEEAKKPWRHLRDAARQALNYSVDREEVRYFVATDGLLWIIFDKTRRSKDNPGNLIDGMLIASFDLTSSTATEECSQAHALWRRPIDPAGKRTRPGNKPTVQPSKRKEANQTSASLQAKMFVHGQPVDDQGNVLGSKGKRYARRPSGTKWFLDGHSLDAEGYVLTKSGKRDSRYKKPYPPNTVRIVDGYPLDKDGRVLAFNGRQDQKFKEKICPPNTVRIVDGRFLNADGYPLTQRGKPDRRQLHRRYPPGAVEFVDGYPLDEEGWVLTKNGKRDKRYTMPYVI